MQFRLLAESVRRLRTWLKKTGHTSMKIRRWKYRTPIGKQYATKVSTAVCIETALNVVNWQPYCFDMTLRCRDGNGSSFVTHDPCPLHHFHSSYSIFGGNSIPPTKYLGERRSLSTSPLVQVSWSHHIGWNSAKIISRPISLTFSLSADPNMTDPLKRERPKF